MIFELIKLLFPSAQHISRLAKLEQTLRLQEKRLITFKVQKDNQS